MTEANDGAAPAAGAPPAAGAAPAAGAVPASSAPSLIGGAAPASNEAPKVEMPAAFEGGADAWGKLDDAGKTAALTAFTEKSTAESKARTEAFAAATDKDGKLAAYATMTKDEKVAAFKAMTDEQKKELGVEDPALPVYDMTKFVLPEGVQIDEKAMGEAAVLFKEVGLEQDQAQKLLTFAANREKAIAEAGVNAYVALQTKWVSEIKADPEIGGDKLPASLADAARAIDRLGGQDLRAAMDLTGAGNNPAIVKALVRMGQMLKEDRFASGNGAAPAAAKSPAETIYGNDPAKPAA